MKYVDSNVFIFPVVSDANSDEKAHASKEILLKIASGEMPASTSTLTWDEFVWGVRKLLGPKVAIAEGRKLLEFPNLKLISVDEKTILISQKLIERYGLRPRDAIHAACCIENGIKEIVSDDGDFDGIGEIRRIGLGKA